VRFTLIWRASLDARQEGLWGTQKLQGQGLPISCVDRAVRGFSEPLMVVWL
jgi:hypothetical protein